MDFVILFARSVSSLAGNPFALAFGFGSGFPASSSFRACFALAVEDPGGSELALPHGVFLFPPATTAAHDLGGSVGKVST